MGHAISVISCLAIILLMRPMVARSDFLTSSSPLVSPIFDDVCKQVECGRGTCKPSNGSTFFFECECDAGWRRISSYNDTNFNFLPCVVPNCTLDYSCQAKPSPSPDRAGRANESIFDPCFWMDCGGGSCNKKSAFTYDCSCAEGYYNLLNATALPCYRECAIGTDCMNLGIGITNTSTPPSPISSKNGNKQDDVCKQVECGRGTCKPSNSSAFFFECECDAGWRQISSHNDTNFNFLPCVIPNCTLDYSCQAKPSPSPDRAGRANESIFDPCFWMDCGGGSCNKKSAFTYDCSCTEGYYNLLNATAFPCYKKCAIGTDCMNLGIGITNTSTPPSPISSKNGNKQASSIQKRNIRWLIALMISLGLIWWT